MDITFKDLIKIVTGSYLKYGAKLSMVDIIDDHFADVIDYTNLYIKADETIAETLFTKLYQKFMFNFCLYSSYSGQDVLHVLPDTILLLFTRLIDRFENTYPKYKKLIQIQNTLTDTELMKSTVTVTSENVNKANSTPQDVTSTESDDYINNLVKSNSTSTTNINQNVINKYEEINKKYQDVYLDWLNEFKGFFW